MKIVKITNQIFLQIVLNKETNEFVRKGCTSSVQPKEKKVGKFCSYPLIPLSLWFKQ